MNQLQKYTWLIETIRRAGKISHKNLSDRWEHESLLSDFRPLPRATFNRWRKAILDQFSIDIRCQMGDNLYYIANPEEVKQDKLKNWMLDSLAVGNAIGESMALKGRILVDEIPSGRDHLITMLEAMKRNRVVTITYHPFKKDRSFTFPVHPYCVKLFENRWYVLAKNVDYGDMRLYGLDRIEHAEIRTETFHLPKDFDAETFFATAFGIVVDANVPPQRIVIRANAEHKPYLTTLPLHHSQRLIEDHGDYADFELYVAPTYDFVMRLLQVGAMVEVLSPPTLRQTMKHWTTDLHNLYKND